MLKGETVMANVEITAEMMEKAKAAESLEALAAAAKAEGVEATDEELAWLWNSMHVETAEKELSDEELSNVAGGCGNKIYRSIFVCADKHCGNRVVWAGDYSKPGRTDLPTCHGKKMIFQALVVVEDR